MRTAILLPAHLRTFRQNFANQYWMVYRHLKGVEFFVSAVDDENASSVEVIRTRYPEDRIHFEAIKQPDDLPEPDPSADLHSPYPRSATRVDGVTQNKALCRGLWHLSRMWNFFLEHHTNGEDYAFFQSRGDYHFMHFEHPAKMPAPDSCFLSWYGNYGGATGLGFFGWRAMHAYLKTWEQLPKLLEQGCPMHPENMVYAAMEVAGISVHRTLVIEWAKREKNEGRSIAEQRLIVSNPLPFEIARLAGAIARREPGTPFYL